MKNKIGVALATIGVVKGEVHIGFRWGNLRETDLLEDPGINGRIISRWIFRKWDVGVQTVSIWLRIETGGGHLFMWQRAFEFHKMWEIF